MQARNKRIAAVSIIALPLVLVSFSSCYSTSRMMGIASSGTVQELKNAYAADPKHILVVDDGGWTLLFRAAAYAKNDELPLLISYGLDPNARDQYGITPLMAAVGAFKANPDNYIETIQILLKAGAKLELADKWGRTALLHSVDHPMLPDIVHELIVAGANVNVADRDGKTALILAGQYAQQIEVLKDLLTAGASPLVKDNDGKTFADYAGENPRLKDSESWIALKKSLGL